MRARSDLDAVVEATAGIRRAVDDDDEIGAGGRGAGDRAAGDPGVFAHHRGDADAVDLDDRHRRLALLEPAVLVEHRVVRQVALAVHRDDLAVAAERGGVVEGVAGDFDRTNDRQHAGSHCGDVGELG